MDQFVEKIERELQGKLKIESVNPKDPIKVRFVPKPWKLLGAGNYAAVLFHPAYQDVVVKIYAPGRPGLKEEAEVYRKLGDHPAYSHCYYAGENYLVLKRLKGITLYDCLKKGIRIPKNVIRDIDQALEYAKGRGLHPHDVHAKNVMMIEGKGVVVDVSDFYKEEYCSLWKDFKKAYYKIYLPFFYKVSIPLPHFFLNIVRKAYRIYQKVFRHEK